MTTRRLACLIALGATVIGCSDPVGGGPDLGPLTYDLLYEGYSGGTPALFLVFVGQETVGAQSELFLMRADGQQLRRVTTDPAWGGGTHPAWRGHF